MKNESSGVSMALQQAALDLFEEHGFEKTTAAQIAARAGVTERTFFRYFPDKREVLFAGEAVLRDMLVSSLVAAPRSLPPIDALFEAFRSTEAVLEANLPFSLPRHRLIARTPALLEREAAKMTTLTAIVADTLKDRGVPPLSADLAARVGMSAFGHAVVSWLDDPSHTLGQRLTLAHEALAGMFNRHGG